MSSEAAQKILGLTSLDLRRNFTSMHFPPYDRIDWYRADDQKWNEQIFKNRYNGRTFAYWQEEAGDEVREMSIPNILAGVNTLEVAPWNNAYDLHNVNPKSGAVDEVYMGIHEGYQAQLLRFDAKFPAVGGIGANDYIYAGFELPFAGGYQIACLQGNNGAYNLQYLLVDYESDHADGSAATAVLDTGNWATYTLILDPPRLILSRGFGTASQILYAHTDGQLGAPLSMFFANESALEVDGYEVGQWNLVPLPYPRPYERTLINAETSTNTLVYTTVNWMDYDEIIFMPWCITNDVDYVIEVSNDEVHWIDWKAQSTLTAAAAMQSADVTRLTEWYPYWRVGIESTVADTHGVMTMNIAVKTKVK